MPREKKLVRATGLMSGTSLDGVDAAWIETDGESIIRPGPAATLDYEPAFRADLRRLLDLAPGIGPDEPFLRDVTHRLTLDHALAVLLLGQPTDLIGFHGQTILHDPANRRTWQIGDAPLLARLTHLPVAHDFRTADVAAGGQGAPLVPLFHAALAAALPKPLAIINIGGVANLTFLGADNEILACDTGPGNAPLDDLLSRRLDKLYDENGDVSATGMPDQTRLDKLLTHPFFAALPPKSLDRQSFEPLIAEAIAGLTTANAAATLAAFTAAAIAITPLPARPRHYLVTGGGRKNATIMRALAARTGIQVDPVESVGWDGDVLEAQCFAYLAVRVLKGLPLSLPTTTGVPTPQPGGRLTNP